MLSGWRELTFEKKRSIMRWVTGVVIVYAVLIAYSAHSMYANRVKADANHAVRMSPTGVEAGKTPPDPVPEQGSFTNVTVGVYVDDFDSFSIKDSQWSSNFYIWFTWKGDKALDPGGKFILVDGAIVKKELMDEYHGTDGVNYQRFRVNGKMIKYFDAARIPLESHMLNFYVEDGARDASQLRFVADDASNISSRANIPGFRFTGHSTVVKFHTYKSTYGDPRLPADSHRTFSQFVAAVQITRIDWGFYFKIFLSLFAALVLALCAFFVKPSDIAPRFALPTSAYFGAVANSYVVNQLLPPSGTFGLVDHIVGFGLFTIFIVIMLSLESAHLYIRCDEKPWALTFDRIMFVVVGLCCLVANVVVPLCARGL